MTENTPISIRALARVAGVSPMTVSLSLRNSPKITAPVRKKIQALAKKLGYRANPLMARLLAELPRQRKPRYTETIAYLTAFRTTASRQAPYMSKLERGLIDRANELGYQVENFNLQPGHLSASRLQSILNARCIRGIVLAPFRDGVRHLSLDYQRFASVAASTRHTKPPIDSVVPNHYANMFVSVRRLLRMGYRRIGFAIQRAGLVRNQFAWLGAYAAALIETSPELAHLYFEMNEKTDEKMFHRWLKKTQVDVVISPYEFVYHWIVSSGRTIPQEIGFVATSCGETEFSMPVSGIDERAFDVGRACCDLLSYRLNYNEIGLPYLQNIRLITGTWTSNVTLRHKPGAP